VPECHSTNVLAHELSVLPATSEGTVVITNKQTAGRGQRGNSWEAEPGKNLTFSVILKPTFLSTKDQFLLNVIMSLAVHDVLKTRVKGEVSIKWPNDIIVNKQKICGILVENQIKGTMVSSSVAGIGLNVNQQYFSVDTATSFFLQNGVEADLIEIFTNLMQMLEARYLQLRAANYDLLKRDYLNNMYWRGEIHEFSSGDSTFSGEIIGIDEIGKLCVKSSSGLNSYDIKNIRYIR
jgi:BirA family biotin operon repressor/biotin-[acetyl-CoA-carboxylase] ligase